jgi:hypothetical protein
MNGLPPQAVPPINSANLSLSAPLRREGVTRRQVADASNLSKDHSMNTHTIAETPSPTYSQACGRTLSLDDVRRRAPAVFAVGASDRTKPTYRFINTHEVLEVLLEAGFQVATARQTRTRQGADPTYARHLIRLRPLTKILTLEDCIPE